jgi:hypothetical protein
VVPRWRNDNVKALPNAELQQLGDLEPLASKIRSFVR